MLITKLNENNTIYTMQEMRLFSCIFSFSISSVSPIFPVHSSTSLSTNFFLHLQFSILQFYIYNFQFSPMSHDLLHSHSQLLGFQINP